MSPKRAGLSEPHAARSPRPGLRERGSLCAPGSSLLAVRSPRPLPVQAETVSPASRKPRGPRGRAPPHPGRGSSSVCLGRAAAREPRAAPPRTGRHRVAPRTARGHAFFLLSMARTTWLFWDTAGNALFFWSVLCVFCVGFFFLFKLCRFPSASLVPSVVESRCSPFVLARVSPAFAQRGLGGGGGRRVLGPGPRSASLTKASEQAPRTRAPAAGPPHDFS